MANRRPTLPGERIFGILLLLLGLAFFWQSYEISGFSSLSSPGAFPLAASAIMVIAALVVVLGNARRPGPRQASTAQPNDGDTNAASHRVPSSDSQTRSQPHQVLPNVVIVFTGMVIVYALVLDELGFLPSSFLFLFITIHYLHRGRLRFSLLVALLALVSIYIVFRWVFTVVLPEGIVPEREIMAHLETLLESIRPAETAP